MLSTVINVYIVTVMLSSYSTCVDSYVILRWASDKYSAIDPKVWIVAKNKIMCK